LTKTGVSSDKPVEFLEVDAHAKDVRRMAVRWMRALVEPEIARRTRSAFSKGGARHDLLRRAIVADQLRGERAGSPRRL